MPFNISLAAQSPDFTLDVNLTLPDQGVTAIFGPSGSGKTTLLRAIAGLDHIANGKITYRDQVWQAGKTFLAPHKRPLGYVFQESSLFPHLTVGQNIAFGHKRVSDGASPEEYDALLALLGLPALVHRRPEDLSGGERQRVAIARALVLKPEILLMDEPMASLDRARKQEILGYLEKLKTTMSIPLIYISHDMTEVTRLADHLVILEQGRVSHQGPLTEILSRHETLNHYCDSPYSLLFGTVQTPCTAHQLTEVALTGLAETTVIRLPLQKVRAGQDIRLHLAAKDISLTLTEPHNTSVLNILPCVIESMDPLSPDGQCLIHLRRGEHKIQAQISAYSCDHLKLAPGQQVFAQIKAISLVQ